jgi:hypothetical protein
MTGSWQQGGYFGFTPEEVRAALAAGGDPDERLMPIRNTPLHEVLGAPTIPGRENAGSVEAVELLIRAGADVEAVNETGETPLWCAVRHGRREQTAALLKAGADPWRTVLGGRSAGRIALDGPLAGLFEDLPGAPVVSEAERRLQREADELIHGYSSWLYSPQAVMAIGEPWALKLLAVIEPFCAAFVAGPDEEETIRRIGADPSACPLLDFDEYQSQSWAPWETSRGPMGTIEGSPEESWLWVSTPPSGGVMIFQSNGILPVNDTFCGRVTTGGGLLASVFHHGEVSVNIWRDGDKAGWPGPFHDPTWEGCPEEAWRCRFGDRSSGFGDLPRSLALMTVLTGVRVDPEWFVTAPKRAVRVSESPV